MGVRGEGASSSYGLEAPSSEAVDAEDWRGRFFLRVRNEYELILEGSSHSPPGAVVVARDFERRRSGYNLKGDGKHIQLSSFFLTATSLPVFHSLMAFRTFFVTCVIFTAALAQSTELQLEAIKAHFQYAELVPVPIPVFDPTAILTANFQGLGDITPGQLVSKDRQNFYA